jgi:16S rRNA A1518/A1519 N6-dimethyltransferase RsmA/KsgA/DIM1 with predicted DNA glycosylase/AP lyase activity
MPWARGDVNLAGPALEIGPGPGLTTDFLLTKVDSLTVLESDPFLAKRLRRRFFNTNVKVIKGDATAMPFEDGTFRTVFSFTMLHHVRSAQLQDQVVAEALRVLTPGGCSRAPTAE